jgi:hypothetical protein
LEEERVEYCINGCEYLDEFEWGEDVVL